MDDSNQYVHTGATEHGNVGKTTKIPVIKEHLSISSKENITGEVQVRKIVRTEEVDVPLTTIRTQYRENRVPLNRVVETMPQVRYEGNNLIIPVVREEEVVVKRLVLVEEIHLIQEKTSEERVEHLELRTEEATVSRKDADALPDRPSQ